MDKLSLTSHSTLSGKINRYVRPEHFTESGQRTLRQSVSDFEEARFERRFHVARNKKAVQSPPTCLWGQTHTLIK